MSVCLSVHLPVRPGWSICSRQLLIPLVIIACPLMIQTRIFLLEHATQICRCTQYSQSPIDMELRDWRLFILPEIISPSEFPQGVVPCNCFLNCFSGFALMIMPTRLLHALLVFSMKMFFLAFAWSLLFVSFLLFIEGKKVKSFDSMYMSLLMYHVAQCHA